MYVLHWWESETLIKNKLSTQKSITHCENNSIVRVNHVGLGIFPCLIYFNDLVVEYNIIYGVVFLVSAIR